MHVQEFLQVKTHSFAIFNGHFSTGQQCCQKDCAEALCSTEWFSLLESRLVESKDALERCGCLVYCVRSTRSNSKGFFCRVFFLQGVGSVQKLDSSGLGFSTGLVLQNLKMVRTRKMFLTYVPNYKKSCRMI